MTLIFQKVEKMTTVSKFRICYYKIKIDRSTENNKAKFIDISVLFVISEKNSSIFIFP